MAYQEIVLEFTNYVSSTDKTLPLTGVYAEDGVDGWLWNRRTSPSVLNDSTRYLTYVGGHEIGLTDGTGLKTWQSGVLEGIDFSSIAHMRVGDDLTWTPRYETGSFSVYWDERVLYSDYSYSENAVAQDTDGRHKLTLRTDAAHSSISSMMFKRLDDFEIVGIQRATMVGAFTGVHQLDQRVELDEGVPADWSLVETRKREMLIEDGVLYFNQDMSHQVGVAYDTLAELQATWQPMGPGLREGRPLFLKYFPLEAGSVELVSVDATGAITTWAEQTTLNFSDVNDKHFSVNHDLGVIETGGYQAPDLVLASALDLFDVEVQVVVSDDLDSYPEQGVIVIDDEQIYYLGKTRKSFIDCVRGYNSTVAAEHTKGTIVADRQHGTSTTDNWYVKYKAVPRVDYEVTDYDLRTANYNAWLDVRALANVKTNNIVQIVSQDSNLAEIILTTDSPLIGGNLYGPVFYGTDSSKLTATGLDSAGNPVEDLDLTIYIKNGTGYLNGTLKSYTAESNSLGQTSCFYNAPYSNDDTLFEVTSVAHVGADTHMTVNFTTAVLPAEVWIFQILKHDPVLGTVGDFASAWAAGSASEPNGLGFIDVWMAYTEDYNGGTVLLEDSAGVRRTLPIRWAEAQKDGNDEPFVRFFLDEAANPTWVSGTAKCWFFQQEAVEWNTVLKRGARVILYEWSTGAQHPITGAAGAWMPVRPDQISGNTMIFEGRNLPIPDTQDREDNLGGYVAIAPSEVRCSAYGRDPFTGGLITSNDVRLRLRLPNTLTGVDETGALPIPYGWTLITEEFNIGAGLDGANFITINPAASGINQFSITGVIS